MVKREIVLIQAIRIIVFFISKGNFGLAQFKHKDVKPTFCENLESDTSGGEQKTASWELKLRL